MIEAPEQLLVGPVSQESLVIHLAQKDHKKLVKMIERGLFPPSPQGDLSSPCLHHTQSKSVSTKITINRLQRTNKRKQNQLYSRYLAYKVEKSPDPNDQVIRPMGPKQGRAPWPRPCWNLEAQSPIEEKKSERTC